MDPRIPLLTRFRQAGPRYTSYPTVPQWTRDFPQLALEGALSQIQGPLSVYVHVPFCAEQCSFCGCNMVVAGRADAGDRYIAAVTRQLDRLPLSPSARTRVLHLGGGTPTWLSPAQLSQLIQVVYSRLPRTDDTELSVEADPAVTTPAHLEALAALGARRVSFGVQCLDPVVLEAVNRPQRVEDVERLVQTARALGIAAVHLDLMIGLPYQTEARFGRTLEHLQGLRPDRVSVFAYAHVPWLKPHQKRLPEDALPGPEARAALALQALDHFTAQGYEAIGLDHFALAEDALSVARRERRLTRNFMGYTAWPDGGLLGLGMSAISDLGVLYAQQHSKLSTWWKAVEADAPVVERGVWLSAEDRLRRAVINSLMCNLRVDWAPLGAAFGVEPEVHFAAELASLAPLVDEGVVQPVAGGLEVTPLGRLLVRNVCMAFDPSLRRPAEGPRYSQTV